MLTYVMSVKVLLMFYKSWTMTEILNSEELKLLADIGFIAVSRGLSNHAGAIFDVIREMRPEQEAGFLGHGMIKILEGNASEALKDLEAAPKTDGVLTFLGIAYIQTGNAQKGKELLEEVTASAVGTPFALIAEETLRTLEAG